MSTRIILLFFFTFLTLNCTCQSIDSLTFLFKDIQKGKNDSIRLETNKKFITEFEKMLLQEGSFTRNFDSLKNISTQTSHDNKFRIYTWVVPHYSGNEYEYFGFIQLHTDTADVLVRLNDSTEVIKKPESEKLTSERWFGAVYYSIIPIKKSGMIYYTLLGWKGKNEIETQKVIEILYFQDSKPKFGFPLIKTGSVFRKRMLFTFNSQVSMALRFDKKYNGIVFDHFSINKYSPESINGPDGRYDILKIKKGRWVLYSDIDAGTKMEPAPPPPEKEH